MPHEQQVGEIGSSIRQQLRDVCRGGDRQLDEQDEQLRPGQEAGQRLPLPPEPFTLVTELDAGNIRERDDWGQSARKRAVGQEPQHWRWTYGGTCLRLDQRVEVQGQVASKIELSGASLHGKLPGLCSR